MRMTHLENSAWAAWLAGEENLAALEHLGWCAACRKEATGLRRALAAFRETIHAAGETHEIAWVRPADDCAEAGWRWAFMRWVPRAALAVCLLAAVLLMHSPRPAPPPASSDAADNALLQSIQNDLSRQVPSALAPAESLVAQMTTDTNQKAQGGNP
jgi:hypothetical protein